MDIIQRVRWFAVALIIAGLGVASAGFLYGGPQASEGLDSAQAMYAAQGITLAYDDEGRLLDRGTPEGAEPIWALLVDEYQYPVNMANFDPDDPLVNTRDELMYQYAVITYHVLHGEVAVTLTDEQVPITYRGVEYTQNGTYMIAVEEYYAELDRTHPIEGQLRAAWSPLALSLVGMLAAGHANQATGELAAATTMGIGALGLIIAAAGAGLLWVTFGKPPDQRT